MKYLYLFAFSLCFPLFVQAQNNKHTLVHTDDIDRFWTAYDSVRTTKDTTQQLAFMQKLYTDKATDGLKAFMKARDYDARLWVELINKYPKFWENIKGNTLQVKGQANAINNSIKRFKNLYPEMRPATMYFTIGGLRSGGTTTEHMVLVGAEIATADKNTDASELSDWLKNVFKNQDASNLVSLNVHEYVHTQQKPGGNTVLAQCIRESAADFIAELVTQKKNNSTYMLYGQQHEAALKESFSIDMFSTAFNNWLYNGTGKAQADLGYYMGYVICKSYYQHATNKKLSAKTIIELNYADEEELVAFLKQSAYYKKPINKEELLKKFDSLQPYVSSIYPAINAQQNVSPGLTELTINFSETMDKSISISVGEGGKDHFPLVGVVGFANDMKSLKLKLALQPGKSYNFIITGRGFKSLTGYPLKEYKVQFGVR